MTYASRRAAEQMQRDGISKLLRWTKPRPGLGCTIQFKIEPPRCENAHCNKAAGYSTPRGNRCFTHVRGEA